MATSLQADDPFVDPSSEAEDIGTDHAFAVNSTLAVGRNASLTLGTDSLIVLGEHIDHSKRASY
jgi:sphingosine kinase